MNDLSSLFGHGLGVALTTPFTADDAIDVDALAQLVDHVVTGGVDFVVALGSTGEASLLDDGEQRVVLDVVGARTAGRVRFVVGVGAPSTRAAIDRARVAAATGADALLVAAPPYVKPSPDGVVAHFRAIVDALPDLPVIAYNVPSRNGVAISPETVRRLWELPGVVGIKESSGDLVQIGRIAAEMPDDRVLLAGDDALVLPTIAVGGHGAVSVAANAVPAAMRELVHAASIGDLANARFLHRRLVPLFDALCREANPVPIKAALQVLGLGRAAPRLPLLPASPETTTALQGALRTLQEVVHHA